MILSLNEIEGGLRKAAIGAGLPVGLAEDAGRAAARLTAAGFDGVGVVLLGLAGDTGPIRPKIKDGLAMIAGANPVAGGVAAIDLVAAGVVDRAQVVAAWPLLLAGLAQVAAQEQGQVFALSFGDAGKGFVSKRGIDMAGRITAGSCDVTIRRAAAGSGIAAPVTVTTGNVDAAVWQQVGALAARTYVAATDASRLSGAGAGLTDND